MSMDEVLESYDRAWNEPDDHERRRLLKTALTDSAELVDPRGRFQGRDAIAERICGFRDRFPGARVDITSGVDEHNGFARYDWKIFGPDGAMILDGIDVCERADDGRLRRIVMFFGSLPKQA
jgi:hypothetical protein